MTIIRKTFKRTNKIAVGDQISLSLKRYGKFTATTQEVTEDGVWFLFDECVVQHMMVNMDSLLEDMKKHINNPSLRKNITFFDLPTYGQIFGHDRYCSIFEEDKNIQWKLMKVRKNRIADCRNDPAQYWLKNNLKNEFSAASFALVDSHGSATHDGALNSYGVRPAFFYKIVV